MNLTILLLFYLWLGNGPCYFQKALASIIDDLENELKNNPVDPSSFSRTDCVRVTHIKWKAKINFEEQVIYGIVDLSITKIAKTNMITLDTSDLTIYEIRDKETNQTLKYELSPVVKIFGSKLTVQLSNKKYSNISISYKTSPNATALNWLKPEQTIGKKYPYLFSQSEPISFRSVVPLQDSPSVKATYEAMIIAPKELVVRMSAICLGSRKYLNDDKSKVYYFKQNIPIPSYLIALAIGNLKSKKVGSRSHVWSEPELIERSAYIFAETERMLEIAESILGPYVWGVYDALILPPIFGIAGMENPSINFFTPATLSLDRSFYDLIAHELSHSWTGDLVTNKNWEHIWLNEGFAQFMERKIVGRLYGEPYLELNAMVGLKSLEDEIKSSGPHNPITKLIPDLRGIDPAEPQVEYEKGYTFLFYLEQILGGPQTFEPFLRAYVQKFKYTSITSNDFKTFLIQYFKDKTHILETIDWNIWLNGTGMPPIIPKYNQSLAKHPIVLSRLWYNLNNSDLSQFNGNDILWMSPLQIRYFLTLLLEREPPISCVKVEALNQIYGLESSDNARLKSLWINLGAKAHCKGSVGPAIDFITSMGLLGYIQPLYQALYDWNETRSLAIKTFMANKNNYMKFVVNALSDTLHLN